MIQSNNCIFEAGRCTTTIISSTLFSFRCLYSLITFILYYSFLTIDERYTSLVVIYDRKLLCYSTSSCPYLPLPKLYLDSLSCFCLFDDSCLKLPLLTSNPSPS